MQNPTVAAFEAMMAAAEGGEAAVGFASGMAAISSALLAVLRPGDRLACVEHVYPDSYRFMERMLRPFGVAVDYHPIAAFEDEPDLLRGVRVAYLESPTSVVFQPMNLPKVAEHARRHGALTMIDNSWATPVLQRPLALGIDIVLHSASKYISGHSDVVAGVVVCLAGPHRPHPRPDAAAARRQARAVRGLAADPRAAHADRAHGAAPRDGGPVRRPAVGAAVRAAGELAAARTRCPG